MTQRDDFFVGYLGRLPQAARPVVPMAIIGLVMGFFGAAMAVALTQDDPGGGAIRWGDRLERVGVLVADPYPHLRVAPDAETPEGATHLVVRAGKRGVIDLAERFDGQVVNVGGVWTRRGEIGMIQINRPIRPVEDAPADATPAAAVDLGRWRLSGEICDSKCYLGAMRPGVGLAHKACANLCISGGAPPVLVTADPVEGETFFLLGDPDGGPLPPDALKDRTAVLITLEGRLERRGDLMVFLTDIEAGSRVGAAP